MKLFVSFLVLLGIGFYAFNQQREENAMLKQRVTELADRLQIPEPERAKVFTSQPLVLEAMPTKPGHHQKVLCPRCNGEGGIIVRRDSGLEVKDMCSLCLGAGKKEFDMPAKAEVCPDCGGMGKRIVVANNASHGTGGLSTSRSGVSNQQFPTTTNCIRCLGKGYIIRPGLQ